MRPIASFLVASTLLLTVGCRKEKEPNEPMTQSEARSALEESTIDSQAAALTTSTVEISTDFTVGKAVTEAAAELREKIAAELPCAEVTLADATLTVAYGKHGACSYKGQSLSGTHAITVAKNEEVIEVDHTFTELSNGKVSVSGTAHVTWDFDDRTRTVEHDLTWTRLRDGRTGRGTGERVQRPLESGLAEGIQVDGSRTWTGQAGRWDLTIEGVQTRWADPIPQAGTYRLATPRGRSLELSFRRVDADSIEATLKTDRREFKFVVNGSGDVAGES